MGVEADGSAHAAFLFVRSCLYRGASSGSRSANGKKRLLSFVKRGLIVIDFSYAAKSERVEQLMMTYDDLPMNFADACLVCMVEENPDSRVFTLDGDFYVYRTAGGEALTVLHPRMAT